MSGTVTQQRQEMSYQEFVWFILSEEDKGTSTAAEFWFRIMDRDGDGVITLEDLEFFYKEQVSRISQRIEPGEPILTNHEKLKRDLHRARLKNQSVR